MEIFKKQVEALLEEKDRIAVLANLSALIFQEIEDINWAGFYIVKDGQLVLGPFQGKIACSRIEIGKGVCGTSVLQKNTLIVDNVHDFDGHIACDSASNSEIVVPIISGNGVYGVIDVDSTSFSRFKDKEKKMLEFIASKLGSYL